MEVSNTDYDINKYLSFNIYIVIGSSILRGVINYVDYRFV